MKELPTNPQEQQLQKLQEIGSYLHQIRCAKEISIEEIASKTRIRVRLLKAIEEAKLEALPEPVYVRGMIVQFADTLGLNGWELAKDFPTNSNYKQLKSSFWLYLPYFIKLRPFHLYFLYIFLVIISVRGLANIVSSSDVGLPKAEIAATPAATPQAKATTKPTQPTPKATAKPNQPSQPTQPEPKAIIKPPIPQPKQDKPLTIAVKIKDESWLKIVADGKTEFEGILPKGTQRNWSAKEKLTVRTGNAGGVLVTFNDKPETPIGKPGQIQEVTYQ
jgi:cytoskeletal protein RodZ